MSRRPSSLKSQDSEGPIFYWNRPTYLGIVEFSGAGKYFAYTRLLQVVNLPDENPYDPSRIPLAQNALKEFLQKNGIFPGYCAF